MKFTESALSAVLMAAAGSALPTELADETTLVPRQNGCADISVFFARGTTEPGTLGVTVGPQFSRAISSEAGGRSVDFEGIPYTALVSGFLVGGDPVGSATMTRLVTEKAAACPNTKIVMSGYSQGGQLVHKAAEGLDAATASRVNAAVIFGDPNNGDPVPQISASQTLVICHVGDNICSGGVLVLPPHLNYAIDADQAARFVAAQTV